MLKVKCGMTNIRIFNLFISSTVIYFFILSQDLVEERVTAASQQVEGSMDLQPIDYDPIYLETIGGQKKQRVYDIGSKGVAFCYSSRASSSSVTAAVDEEVEHRVMETNERIAVMETEMKEKDQ